MMKKAGRLPSSRRSSSPASLALPGSPSGSSMGAGSSVGDGGSDMGSVASSVDDRSSINEIIEPPGVCVCVLALCWCAYAGAGHSQPASVWWAGHTSLDDMTSSELNLLYRQVSAPACLRAHTHSTTGCSHATMSVNQALVEVRGGMVVIKTAVVPHCLAAAALLAVHEHGHSSAARRARANGGTITPVPGVRCPHTHLTRYLSTHVLRCVLPPTVCRRSLQPSWRRFCQSATSVTWC